MILQQPFAIPASTNRVYTRALTIDATEVPSTQSNFPVLVNFTDATFKTVANGGHVKATNAFTFSSDSGGSSLLKWEVERYNASTGEIVAWVKIASVDGTTDTVFYLRYGGSITTDQSDAANVWTNSFVSVFHLKDGTTLSLVDSTGSGRNLTNVNTVTAAAGQIDGCGGFASASTQHLTNASGNNPGTAFSISAWVKGTTFPNSYNTVLTLTSVGVFKDLFVKSTGKLACYLSATGTVSYDGTGSTTLSTGTWYLLHMTYSSSAGLIGYVNGGSDGSAAANGNAGVTDVIDIGNDAQNANRLWNGSLDEVRTASVARGADWITCEYNNQKTSQTFISLGSET